MQDCEECRYLSAMVACISHRNWREVRTARFTGHGDGSRFRAEVEARCRFEVLEEVVAVDEIREGVPLAAGDRVVVTSAWRLRSGRGHGYWVVTTASCDQVAGDEGVSGCARVERERGGTVGLMVRVVSS